MQHIQYPKFCSFPIASANLGSTRNFDVTSSKTTIITNNDNFYANAKNKDGRHITSVIRVEDDLFFSVQYDNAGYITSEIDLSNGTSVKGRHIPVVLFLWFSLWYYIIIIILLFV